jgi:hypothetical protein
MTDVDRSRRIPIDEAELAAWLAETLDLPTDMPRLLLDPQTESLRRLMQNMRETLVPIEPSPNFVRELGHSLTTLAGQQPLSFRQRYGRMIVFGLAAAGSVVSVVSVGAYWYLRREQRQSRSL